ncbi:hypothetical protein ACIRPH_27515 [Nocardiopsis sp. NPDC101807]|uniref:hypothetical protein n=1 Tax=Nocardiopsis sp. NPDC101807 TaxID=3364339 RepID=UPI00380CCB69
MRTAAKITMTALFAAGLLGMGTGAALAGEKGSHVEAYEACTSQQSFLGLINLDLNLLNQCIANYNR